MLDKVTELLKIKKLTRLNNTFMGNPMWSLQVVDTFGIEMNMTTARNNSVGYRLTDVMEGDEKIITYHCTSKGNFIMTDIIV